MIVLHTSLSADLSLLILNPDQVGYKGHRNIFQCYNLTFIQPHIQTIGYKKHLHFYAVYPWDIWQEQALSIRYKLTLIICVVQHYGEVFVCLFLSKQKFV